MRLPLIDRALANLRYKLTWIGEQKEKLKASYKEFEDVQDEMERENQMKVSPHRSLAQFHHRLMRRAQIPWTDFCWKATSGAFM